MEPASAFVLHHRAYRETSLLVDAFTLEQGRIRLIAKGVRKRQNNSLQLFQPLWMSWYGYGELATLKQAETTKPAYRLTGNASLCGLYMNELLVRLLPLHETEADIFQAYEMTLAQLQSPSTQQVVLRLFEKALLMHLGYGLQLQYEVHADCEIDDNTRYVYHPESGPQRSLHSNETHTISGRSLRILRQESGFDDISLREIKGLMRQVINYYLGGRPLHSRQLFSGAHQFKIQKEGD